MNNSKISASATPSDNQLDTKDLLLRLRDEYAKAERIAKDVGDFRDETGVPAINELRYAGHHALIFATSEAEGKASDAGQLISAINHCRRASYEAGEAGIMATLVTVDEFSDEFSEVGISSVIPNWVEILKRCDEIKDKVSAARKTDEDRSPDHEFYQACFYELRDCCRTLRYARDELAKKVRDRQDSILEAQISSRRFIVGTIIALFGLVITVSFGVLPYFIEGS